MDVIRTLALKGATALCVGMFCFGAVAPSPVLAQGKPAMEMKAKPKTMAKKAPDKSVMMIQEALNKNGAKLAVDGRMGKMTRTALRKYQKDNGLKVTGMVDKATKAKLGTGM
jgi:peptidoglycan hydrolase-like protein with peptidoglycan-binding domain